MSDDTKGQGRGIWYGFSAYALWGIFPVYFKLIGFVPADQVVAHRIVWSFLLLAAVRLGAGVGLERQPMAVTRRVVALYTAAACLIALNWFFYVWAVAHNFIVETSLGYFVTPLVNVLIGVVILGERLRRLQWVAIALAAAGVAYLTFVYGRVPWIAITLAVTFGTYGLVKKKAPLPSLAGLTLETGLLFIPALVFLALTETRGDGTFFHSSTGSQFLIALSGPITTLPLALFAAAVQRVPLSVIGILQFVGPTIQFVIGVAGYHEPFNYQQLAGFMLVWLAVIVFCSDGLAAARRRGASPIGVPRRA